MKETSLLMKGPLVLATLADRKTMTRRHITQRNSLIDGCIPTKKTWAALDWSQPDRIRADLGPSPAGNPGPYLHVPNIDGDRWHRVYPRVQPGTKIWVREFHEFCTRGPSHTLFCLYRADMAEIDMFDAPYTPKLFKGRPGIHMPRWACRLELDTTKVRAERLNDISAKDILAEGVVDRPHHNEHFGKMPVSALDGMAYVDLRSLWYAAWEIINGTGSYVLNPWVWVYEYRRLP